ncbi:MAG: hypothetical protein JNK46_16575 [Methylobacteriaceae bacterium]|nr:hypothetical protein [Methylobacteriaceae bacterium]
MRAALALCAALMTTAPAVAMDARIDLARGACEARCPVYSVSVGGDGAVVYEGRHYVQRRGRVERRIAPAAAAALLRRFSERSFLDGPETIAPGGPDCALDGRERSPIALTFRAGTTVKRLAVDGRCDGPAAQAARQLARAVDEAARLRGLTR